MTKGEAMKAIRPNIPRRRTFSGRSALPITSAIPLLFVAAFSLMTTGCGDDTCCTGGASDASGLGGYTYTARTLVGQAGAELVLVTRGGGSTSAASTGGLLGADLGAGPVDGVLTFDSGLREVLSGSYDPSLVDDFTLTARSTGNVTFEGDATPSTFDGTLTVTDVGDSPISGTGRQEDAPLINLLGTWRHNTDIVANCGTMGQYEVTCAGFTRIRKVGLFLRMDTYESCESDPFVCDLSGPALRDGVWRGLNYTETVSSARTIQNCPVRVDGELNLRADAETLSSDTNGNVTFTNANCLPANTVCALTQQMSATRCVDCWPQDCTDGF